MMMAQSVFDTYKSNERVTYVSISPQMFSMLAKLNIDDKNRVSVAVDHYEPYLDFDELLRRTTSANSSFNEPGCPRLEDLKRL